MVSEKQKLTLSVEKNLVEKAKKLGVNISEVTETVLRHISETQTKEVVTQEELNDAYKKIFDAMLPAMRKFGASVVVGYIFEKKDGSHNISMENISSASALSLIIGRIASKNIMGSRDVILLASGKLCIRGLDETPKFEEVSFYVKNFDI